MAIRKDIYILGTSKNLVGLKSKGRGIGYAGLKRFVSRYTSADKGFFMTPEELIAAFPVGIPGWRAIVEETKTTWYWSPTANARVENCCTPDQIPTISISSPEAGIYEAGQSVGPVNIDAIVVPGIDPITSIDFFRGASNIQSGLGLTAVDNGPFTSDTTWNATVTDGTLSGVSNNVSISFLSKMYRGTNPNTTINESDILALTNSSLSNTFVGTRSFASELGSYKYFARPISLGQPSDPTVDFIDNNTNFPIPFELQGIVNVTNAYAYSQDYYVYRSINVLGGALDIRVQA